MNKSIGLAALCALISPSIATAQDSATVNTVIGIKQADPTVEIFGLSSINFGKIIIPRSNDTLDAKCEVEMKPSASDGSPVYRIETDIDGGTLESLCEVEVEGDIGRFEFICRGFDDLVVQVDFRFQEAMPSVFALSDVQGVIRDKNGNFSNIDTNDFNENIPESADIIECRDAPATIYVGGDVTIDIEAAEENIFNSSTDVDNYNIGTFTMSAIY